MLAMLPYHTFVVVFRQTSFVTKNRRTKICLYNPRVFRCCVSPKAVIITGTIRCAWRLTCLPWECCVAKWPPIDLVSKCDQAASYSVAYSRNSNVLFRASRFGCDNANPRITYHVHRWRCFSFLSLLYKSSFHSRSFSLMWFRSPQLQSIKHLDTREGNTETEK